jgi:CHASE3 domain sensor protein
MTIRAKLYAAIVLTVLGPLATTAVALHGMSQLGDRFDEVRERAEREAVARELKFLVTDANGWQTAYGYAGGDLRDRFVSAAGELREELDLAAETLTDEREQVLVSQLEQRFESFMQLDTTAFRLLQAGRDEEVRDIFLGPELDRFEAMAATAQQLAAYEADQAAATEAAFDDARDDARRRLIAVALGAGVVIILLLVTANDIARLALEGERRRSRATSAEPSSDRPS